MNEQYTPRNNRQGSRQDNAGKGIFIGASAGILPGLLLLKNVSLGMGAGAAVGLIIGAALDIRKAG